MNFIIGLYSFGSSLVPGTSADSIGCFGTRVSAIMLSHGYRNSVMYMAVQFFHKVVQTDDP